ncbi:MAG: BlaI/MecI/CopY family transcriptional regulator [Planctomycetes bacterium]|nr:BlaI/MecI/CopY family transcriptional regulator [Planctomycetota bacterium]
MELIGPLQVKVMHHIWTRGPSTVHDVHDELMADPHEKRLAYTTILTVMRNLARRGFLAQQPEGRAHRFAARIDEGSYKRELLHHVRTEVFRGDLRSMLDAVAADESLSPEQREKVRGLLVAAG